MTKRTKELNAMVQRMALLQGPELLMHTKS